MGYIKIIKESLYFKSGKNNKIFMATIFLKIQYAYIMQFKFS